MRLNFTLEELKDLDPDHRFDRAAAEQFFGIVEDTVLEKAPGLCTQMIQNYDDDCCAHGEYSEYPASTLVPRPDYWAQAEVESTVGYSIHLLVGFHGREDPPWGARSDTR